MYNITYKNEMIESVKEVKKTSNGRKIYHVAQTFEEVYTEAKLKQDITFNYRITKNDSDKHSLTFKKGTIVKLIKEVKDREGLEPLFSAEFKHSGKVHRFPLYLKEIEIIGEKRNVYTKKKKIK